MKTRKLASLLAVTLSFELMVSPLIPMARAAGDSVSATAASDNKSSSASQSRDRGPEPQSKVNSAAEAIGVTLQAVGQIWGQVRQGMNLNSNSMTSQMANDMARLQEQQKPQADKYFNSQKLMQIPGLANYLALNNINPGMLNCSTLPTTLHDAKPEVCRVGITGDKGLAPQAQMDQMFTYYNQYFQVSKLYKNYRADSNTSGQSFGVGCMNNAMNILNGFFKYRIDELDKLTTNLEAMQDQFKKASRSDLDAIEEATAVLDGNSPMADKVRSKKPELFDFQKRFSNQACISMFTGDELNNKGREGGLNQITADLKKTMSTKMGKFSGESYAKNHAAVLEDLESLADKVSKQLELNFSTLSKDPNAYGQFLNELPGRVSSTNGINRALSADLFSDVQTKFNDTFLKLNEQKITVLSELRGAGISGDAATSLLGNAASNNFESEVVTIENNLKNKCFQDSLSEMDIEKIMDKIYDPTASSHANKYASNFIKDKLSKILNNKDTSLEKKLAELQSLEAQNKGRYYLKMENSYEVQDVDANGDLKTEIVSASNIRTPTVFFSDLIKNCNAQFKSNKLENKMSGASAIQKLRELNQQFKDLAKSQSADMKKEVRRKLIECTSTEDANNTNPGSCTPERFNTSSPGFCANAAFSCSKNMQACTQQAQGFSKEIKDQRTARVNNYKALVDKNKSDIVKMFDTALASYMRDGELIRGMFGAGFTSPAGIQREVSEGEKYLSEFSQATSRSIDGELLLEDPDAYVKMFKQNIALLKDSVKKQQDQILGGESTGQGMRSGGLLAQHIKKTDDNYKDVLRESEQIANMCLQKHDSAIAASEQQRAKQQEEQMKKMTELGEKRNEFCDMYGMVRQNPAAMCGEVQASFVKDSLKGVAAINAADPNHQMAARDSVGKLSQYCSQVGNYSEKQNGAPYDGQTLCEMRNQEGVEKILKDPTLLSNIKKLCDDADKVLEKCSDKPDTSATSGDSKVVSSCIASHDKLLQRVEAAFKSYQALNAANAGVTVDLEDAPAYCSSGDNSTNRWAKAIQTIGTSAAQAIGASGK